MVKKLEIWGLGIEIYARWRFVSKADEVRKLSRKELSGRGFYRDSGWITDIKGEFLEI
jgi:hypothetical protein